MHLAILVTKTLRRMLLALMRKEQSTWERFRDAANGRVVTKDRCVMRKPSHKRVGSLGDGPFMYISFAGIEDIFENVMHW